MSHPSLSSSFPILGSLLTFSNLRRSDVAFLGVANLLWPRNIISIRKFALHPLHLSSSFEYLRYFTFLSPPLLIRLVDVESPLGGNWKWEMSTLDDLEFFFFLIRSSCGKLERYISLFYFFFSRNVIKIRNLNIFKLFVIVTRLLKTSSGFRLGWLLVNCEKLNHFQFNALVFEVKMRRKYCNFIAVVYCSYLRIFLLTISAFIYKGTCLDFV